MEHSVYQAYAEFDSEKDLYRLDLKVGGAHCAACIQKIESALHRQENIDFARLNFSTKRLHIEWVGTPEDADRFAHIIEDLGYSVSVFDTGFIESDSDAESRDLLVKLGIAGFATGNIMLLSFALWTTTTEIMGMATRDFMHLITALIAIPTVLYSGQPFFRSAYSALKVKTTNMDVPISLALVLATGMSLFETFRHGEHVYFDSAVMLIFFLLIGRYLDSKARRNARSNATELLSMLSGTATILDNGETKLIPIRDIREGMTLVIAAGQKVPADAVITKGSSNIDTALVTGETIPRETNVGDTIYAGTMNLDAPLTATVCKATNDSLLSDIIRLIEKAEQSQAQYVRLADKAAQFYTPTVHFLALASFLGWWLIGGIAWQSALMISVTVLIITCPCALGLAVPVVQILATGSLMKRGILVKSGDALERLAKVDHFFFDKTGTLTLGKPQLLNPEHYDRESLKIAASLAVHSHHPLSKAICAHWDDQVVDMNPEEIPNKGVQWKSYRLGSRKWCGDEDFKAPEHTLELWLNTGDQKPIVFLFSDRLRDDSQKVIQDILAMNMHVSLISGDRAQAANEIGEKLSISTIWSECSPTQKYEILENCRSDGSHIAMVGDGLNDAPVLAGADVSLSPSSAIDLAQNSADIIFNGDQLRPVLTAYNTAFFTQRLVKQNFALAILYNLCAVPLALSGMVTPMIAAIAMSSSSLIVIANSYRLKLKMKDM